MVVETEINRLAETIGLESSELAAFELLDAQQIEHLAGALRDAQARQSDELETAIQQALSYVPALMRRPILKILGR